MQHPFNNQQVHQVHAEKVKFVGSDGRNIKIVRCILVNSVFKVWKLLLLFDVLVQKETTYNDKKIL